LHNEERRISQKASGKLLPKSRNRPEFQIERKSWMIRVPRASACVALLFLAFQTEDEMRYSSFTIGAYLENEEKKQ